VKYIRLCICISVFLLSSAFSTTRAIELSLNQSQFSSGDTLVLTLNEDWSGEVDVYIALSLPTDNGLLTLFFLTPDGFNPNMRAYSQVAQASGLKEVFRLVLPEISSGEYTFYATLMLPNTFQLISEIVEASLVFQAQGQSDVTPGEVFRDSLQDGSLGPEMVWIPAGTFRMGDIQGGGDSEEQPVHEVSVDGFAMGRFEVTFDEYDKFAEATGREKPDDRGWGRGNLPVIMVSWNDATAYAEWLSEQTGHTYRLPTEAEWEYSARAGTETKYWWGNDIGSNKANCSNVSCGDSFEYTAPVGSFDANQFGLYDTAGNVLEWTCSSYTSSYNGEEQQCGSGSFRVLRGGTWLNGPMGVRLANRTRGSVVTRIDNVGFRLTRL